MSRYGYCDPLRRRTRHDSKTQWSVARGARRKSDDDGRPGPRHDSETDNRAKTCDGGEARGGGAENSHDDADRVPADGRRSVPAHEPEGVQRGYRPELEERLYQ